MDRLDGPGAARSHSSCQLRRQKKGRAEIIGGLEARRLESWSAKDVRSSKPKQVSSAYDAPAALVPRIPAASLCWKARLTKRAHQLRADMLGGYQREDRPGLAERHVRQAPALRIIPTAKLYRCSISAAPSRPWREFQRRWARAAMAASTRFCPPIR